MFHNGGLHERYCHLNLIYDHDNNPLFFPPSAYLRLDVYLLADIFETFRKMALDQDGLDPANYLGLPGLTWDSAFKLTGVKIDLLQDPDMYSFFESGIRGGGLLF